MANWTKQSVIDISVWVISSIASLFSIFLEKIIPIPYAVHLNFAYR